MTTEGFMKAFAARALALTFALSLSLPALSQPQQDDIEDPSFAAMAVDLVFVRPVMLVTTAAGAAIWTVSLPFSLAGGNAGESAEVLVGGPAKTTFVRCLGCTNNGYKKD